MFRRLFVTGLGILFVPALALAVDTPTPGAPTGDSSEVVEILKKADAAAKTVKSAKYELRFEGLGETATKIPLVVGTWLTAEIGENGPKKYRMDVTLTAPGKEPQKFTAGTDGETYYLFDHDKKKAYVDIDPNVIGRTVGEPLRRATMSELGHPAPFSDEIDGKVKELKGSKTIDGEDCFEIFVTYKSAPQDAIWWFSKKDFLPRARQDIFKRGETTNTSIKTLAKLEINPSIPPDAFKVAVPAGYEKTDDFAP